MGVTESIAIVELLIIGIPFFLVCRWLWNRGKR
jgi:hypothetical protein